MEEKRIRGNVGVSIVGLKEAMNILGDERPVIMYVSKHDVGSARCVLVETKLNPFIRIKIHKDTGWKVRGDEGTIIICDG